MIAQASETAAAAAVKTYEAKLAAEPPTTRWSLMLAGTPRPAATTKASQNCSRTFKVSS